MFIVPYNKKLRTVDIELTYINLLYGFRWAKHFHTIILRRKNGSLMFLHPVNQQPQE